MFPGETLETFVPSSASPEADGIFSRGKMQLYSRTLEVGDTRNEVFSFSLLASFHSKTLLVQTLLSQALDWETKFN